MRRSISTVLRSGKFHLPIQKKSSFVSSGPTNDFDAGPGIGSRSTGQERGRGTLSLSSGLRLLQASKNYNPNLHKFAVWYSLYTLSKVCHKKTLQIPKDFNGTLKFNFEIPGLRKNKHDQSKENVACKLPYLLEYMHLLE